MSKGDVFQRAFTASSWEEDVRSTSQNHWYSGNSLLGSIGCLACGKPDQHKSFADLSSVENTNVTSNEKSPYLLFNSNVQTIRSKRFVSIECGGDGNCFFKSISRGLENYGIMRTHEELRKMLSDQLSQPTNAASFQVIYGATPNDIVPYIGHLSHHCPSAEGWSVLQQNWNQQDWGNYLRVDGRWAGGLEIVPMNMCFQQYYIKNTVNVWKRDICFLCEEYLENNTIVLMLSNNHFTYFEEVQTYRHATLALTTG